MKQVIYIWKPDLMAPSDKGMMHMVEVYRGKLKKGQKLDRRWVRFSSVTK